MHIMAASKMALSNIQTVRTMRDFLMKDLFDLDCNVTANQVEGGTNDEIKLRIYQKRAQRLRSQLVHLEMSWLTDPSEMGADSIQREYEYQQEYHGKLDRIEAYLESRLEKPNGRRRLRPRKMKDGDADEVSHKQPMEDSELDDQVRSDSLRAPMVSTGLTSDEKRARKADKPPASSKRNNRSTRCDAGVDVVHRTADADIESDSPPTWLRDDLIGPPPPPPPPPPPRRCVTLRRPSFCEYMRARHGDLDKCSQCNFTDIRNDCDKSTQCDLNELQNSSMVPAKIITKHPRNESTPSAVDQRSNKRVLDKNRINDAASLPDSPTPTEAAAQVKQQSPVDADHHLFDGDFRRFPRFWEKFVSEVHEKRDHSDATKLLLLKGRLNRKAKLFIHDIFDYSEALRVLVEYFGDIEYIVTDVFNKIITFTKPQSVTDVARLKELLYTMNQGISLLNLLGLEQLHHTGVIYSTLLLRALPDELVYKYLSKINDKRPYPYRADAWALQYTVVIKYKKLRTFVEQEIAAIEKQRSSWRYIAASTVAHADAECMTGFDSSASDTTSEGRCDAHEPPPAICQNKVQNNDDTNRHERQRLAPCTICSGTHSYTACSMEAPLSTRVTLLRKADYCTGCLKFGHTANTCPLSVRCHKCKSTDHMQPMCPAISRSSLPMLPNVTVHETDLDEDPCCSAAVPVQSLRNTFFTNRL